MKKLGHNKTYGNYDREAFTGQNFIASSLGKQHMILCLGNQTGKRKMLKTKYLKLNSSQSKSA